MARWQKTVASRIEKSSIEKGVTLLKQGYFLIARAAAAAQDPRNKKTLDRMQKKLFRTLNRVAKTLHQKH